MQNGDVAVNVRVEPSGELGHDVLGFGFLQENHV